jgi:hypothetical protein
VAVGWLLRGVCLDVTVLLHCDEEDEFFCWAESEAAMAGGLEFGRWDVVVLLHWIVVDGFFYWSQRGLDVAVLLH